MCVYIYIDIDIHVAGFFLVGALIWLKDTLQVALTEGKTIRQKKTSLSSEKINEARKTL